MTAESADFAILWLPWFVPAHVACLSTAQFPWNLTCMSSSRAWLNLSFSLKDWYLCSCLLPGHSQVETTLGLISLEVSWITQVFLTLRNPSWLWCVAWGHLYWVVMTCSSPEVLALDGGFGVYSLTKMVLCNHKSELFQSRKQHRVSAGQQQYWNLWFVPGFGGGWGGELGFAA